MRSHDFFFSDGDGDGDDGDDAGSVACCGGEQDDAELMLVSCEARLDTESLDSCRLPSCNSPLQYIFFVILDVIFGCIGLFPFFWVSLNVLLRISWGSAVLKRVLQGGKKL